MRVNKFVLSLSALPFGSSLNASLSEKSTPTTNRENYSEQLKKCDPQYKSVAWNKTHVICTLETLQMEPISSWVPKTIKYLHLKNWRRGLTVKDLHGLFQLEVLDVEINSWKFRYKFIMEKNALDKQGLPLSSHLFSWVTIESSWPNKTPLRPFLCVQG